MIIYLLVFLRHENDVRAPHSAVRYHYLNDNHGAIISLCLLFLRWISSTGGSRTTIIIVIIEVIIICPTYQSHYHLDNNEEILLLFR